MRRLTIVLAILGLVAAGSAGASSYTVKRGDTLGMIATRLGTSVSSLVHSNGLKDADHIVIGQVLKVGDAKSGQPGPAVASAPPTYTVKRGQPRRRPALPARRHPVADPGSAGLDLPRARQAWLRRHVGSAQAGQPAASWYRHHLAPRHAGGRSVGRKAGTATGRQDRRQRLVPP